MTGKSYDKPKRYLSALAAALALTHTVEVCDATAHHLQYQALGMDPYTGIQDFLHPGVEPNGPSSHGAQGQEV